MDKLETLKSALGGRNDEIMSYQINIDNYERAIAKIDAEYSDNPAMIEYRDRMRDLLLSSRTEQLKASVIRDVIADQVNEIEAN